MLAGQDTVPPQWPYWLYLSNFSIAEGGWVHGWVDVSWLLAIEEQFYLVWPLVIWLCPSRVVAGLCAVILVAERIARIYAREINDPAVSGSRAITATDVGSDHPAARGRNCLHNRDAAGR